MRSSPAEITCPEEDKVLETTSTQDAEHTREHEETSENIVSVRTPDRCCADSTLEVQSPSSPCASHFSEASLFSIDSPPHPDPPTEDREIYGRGRSASDCEAIEEDDIIDDVFHTGHQTNVQARDGSLLCKAESDTYDTIIHPERHIGDRTKSSDGDVKHVMNMVNIRTEEGNKSHNTHEFQQECDTVNDSDGLASASLIGAYIRLDMGSYTGRLARITSMNKDRSRYSVSVLRYEGLRQLSKHTTIVAGSENVLEEDGYTACDISLIEQDREYLKVREGAMAGMMQNKMLRTEEMQRMKIERAATRTNASGSTDVEDEVGEREGGRDGEEEEGEQGEHSKCFHELF